MSAKAEGEDPINEEPAEENVADALDDLFGDESEVEEQTHSQENDDEAENGSDASSATKIHRRVIDDEEDEEQAMYNRKFLGEDYGDRSDEELEEEEKRHKEVDVELVKHVVPYKTANGADDKTIYYAKIPQFLTVDPLPFDPPTFQKKVEERVSKYSSKEDQLGDRLIEENTLRWRYSRDKEQHVFKESNAQIVEWSDGTFSLKVGEEYTDILVNNTENTYLTVSHEEQELIQCVEGGEVTKVMMFVPTSTNSKVHQILSKAVARREEREQQGPSTYIVRKDPELEARELERKHDQVLRERRKKQLKEKLEQENAAGDSPEPQFNLQKSLSRHRNLDEYEYDDGFVAHDDDEEEEEEEFSGSENEGSNDQEEDSDLENENAERLRRLKKAGAEEYQNSETKKRNIAVLDDEEDE